MAATLAAVAAGTLLLAASARGVTTVRIEAGGTPLRAVPMSESLVFIDGDEGRNDIRLAWAASGTEFVVRDRRARVMAPACERLGVHTARCPYARERNFAVLGHGEDDRLDLGYPPQALHPEVLGDRGDDVLAGTGFNDLLFGGPGNDELTGRGGNDFLAGAFGRDLLRGSRGRNRLGGDLDPGPDTSRGGPGDDRIRAADHTSDRLIAGGPGDDHCRIDEFGDPKPRRCERVARGPRPDPFA